MWHLTFDIWQMTPDIWHVTYDTWHLTHVWYTRCGEQCLQILGPQILQLGRDSVLKILLEKMNKLMKELMNKPAAQAAGADPSRLSSTPKIPLFTKIAITFDPIKGFRCPSRFK